MILITGATGNVGSIVARNLISKEKKVRVVSRHGIKMKDFYNAGAEVLIGDLSHPKFVDKAFEGISATFCIMPPNNLSDNIRKYRQGIAHNYINAVKKHGVRNVILMSSLGAHLREGSGIVDGLADMEVSFSGLKDVNVLILRAGYFMENLYFELNRLRSSGTIGSTIRGELKFPIVAAKDVAAVVEKRLLALDFTGHTIEYVLGPKDISFNEIAEIVGRALNRPEIKYKRLTKNDCRNEMIQSGYISENVADAFIEMEEVFNNGKGLNAHTRTSENSTPTTFEEFAKGIASVYHHQTAA
jgi:uncharacterized protein YbjT (DUF2867 family)